MVVPITLLNTVILRFRDLVTERGQTIERHRTIVNRERYVWWGWWAKFGERVADDAFRALADIASGEGLQLYLMDSGQELLYGATCTDIRWDPRHAEIPSPEIDHTPAYYSEQSFLAWFRLTNIAEETDERAILERYTYLRVDDFFEDGESRYTPFYDKQVGSIRELRQQDRSIWFLRDFRPGDSTREISLLETQAAVPQHFNRDYFQTSLGTLLWVSDLHFSEDGHHAFPVVGTDQVHEFNLAHQIENSLRLNEINALAGVIISGDVTWKAAQIEFEMALSFVRRLAVWSPLRSEQIGICPGNHDLRFSNDPADKHAPVTIIGAESREAYSRFYEHLFYVAPNQFLSCGRRFLLAQAVPIEVVFLNSSYLQQERGSFQGHGFIGEQQLKDAEDGMGWKAHTPNPSPYRIAVLHHHVLPTTFRFAPERDYPYSVVLDAEAFIRWVVRHRVNLVLHGHMHQPYCARVARPIDVQHPEGDWHEFAVVGMGSSGVQGELGEVGRNTFGLLTVERHTLVVSVWTVHPTNPSTRLWQIQLPWREIK